MKPPFETTRPRESLDHKIHLVDTWLLHSFALCADGQRLKRMAFLLGQVRKPVAVEPNRARAPSVRYGAQTVRIAVRQRRKNLTLTQEESSNIPAILPQQSISLIFRMTLKENEKTLSLFCEGINATIPDSRQNVIARRL